MQLRHIVGLDIVKNEVNRIMPNSLTENKLHENMLNDEAEEQKTMEQIKKELEDVDDVFAANVWSALAGQNGDSNLGAEDSKEKVETEDPPEEEWLKTSSDEEGENAEQTIGGN